MVLAVSVTAQKSKIKKISAPSVMVSPVLEGESGNGKLPFQQGGLDVDSDDLDKDDSSEKQIIRSSSRENSPLL